MNELLLDDYVEWGYGETGTILGFKANKSWVLIKPDNPWLKNRWVLARECRKL